MNDMPWYSWLCLAPLAVFLIWLFFASRKAERDGNRKYQIWSESEDRQREWLLGQPDPEDPQYARCWNEGGGDRFVRDRLRYLREHPKPKEIPRDSTTNPWR
jgi:hypothetical protein